MIYVRCREEQGPDCAPNDFHKPLSTLPQTDGPYKNWRYFFTIISLLFTCSAIHFVFSRGGNLNGISLPVLVSGYTPWISVIMMICYWALQAFPTNLIAKLLPWQQNILAQGVLLLSLLGLIILVINPKLVYLIPKKRRHNQVPKQDSVATYYNYLKSNWRSTLGTDSPNPMTIAYGLGTCLSSLTISVTWLLSLVSMLVLGDGQAPALPLHRLSVPGAGHAPAALVSPGPGWLLHHGSPAHLSSHPVVRSFCRICRHRVWRRHSPGSRHPRPHGGAQHLRLSDHLRGLLASPDPRPAPGLAPPAQPPAPGPQLPCQWRSRAPHWR